MNVNDHLAENFEYKNFDYTRRAAFCDTDAMGVVHHANYLKYFEEARVGWMRARGLTETHFPEADCALAVIESRVLHHKPVYFDDLMTIRVQVKRDGLKITFRYALTCERSPEKIATGETVHVAVNKELRPIRLNPKFIAALEKEKWIETWPWSS
jgi:acyl-CoA thioester hydrolase